MDSDWAASALKWWEDAGVDTFVGETPRNWLAPTTPRAAVAEEAAPPPVPTLPDTLDAFRDWLLTGDVPFAAPSAARVGPQGDPASGLMILVDMPSAVDIDADSLLSGEAGELFDRMMTAIGRSRETLYLASLAPVRIASGGFDAASASAFAMLARHHAGLVRPKALLLFGDGSAKALLGASVVQARGKWHELETSTGKVRTLVTIRPEKLMSQPGLKKHAWEDLQRLREELES